MTAIYSRRCKTDFICNKAKVLVLYVMQIQNFPVDIVDISVLDHLFAFAFFDIKQIVFRFNVRGCDASLLTCARHMLRDIELLDGRLNYRLNKGRALDS